MLNLRLRLIRQTYGFSHRAVSRNKSADSGCSFPSLVTPFLRTNCVQPVSLYMNNEWVRLPQVTHVLWMNYVRLTILSPLAHFFLRISHAFPTTLFALKKREITDATPYFSTLSTLPITTTTIYI